MRTVDYTANALNQYAQIVTPGSFAVLGRGGIGDTVTVNGAAALRQGDRFRGEVTVNNTANPVLQGVTVKSRLDQFRLA